MDFFTQQDQARRRTAVLICLLLLLLPAAVTAVYAAVLCLPPWLFGVGQTMMDLYLPYLPAAVLVTLGGVLVAAAWKADNLRTESRRILAGMGVREPAALADDETLVLRHVVEEMAVAAGVAVPRVMVLPDEPAINGFAWGNGPADATLVVTRGALRHLDRAELQALVAHEFSHLLHGDSRLNLRLVAVLHGLEFLSSLGDELLGFVGDMLHPAGTDARNGKTRDSDIGMPKLLWPVFGAVIVAGFLLLLSGFAGRCVAGLVRIAVNRQRDHLADAAAVQFTRDPDAMVRLLGKILVQPRGRQRIRGWVHEFAHVFFVDIFRRRTGRFFSTHPPLENRIHRINPAWTRAELPVLAAPSGTPRVPAPRRDDPPVRSALQVTRLVRLTEVQDAPGRVADAVGQAEQEHLARARATLAALPAGLRDLDDDPLASQAVVLLLLTLDRDTSLAELAPLLTAGDPGLEHELRARWDLRATLAPEARLPLLDRCVPALRRMTPAQHARFREVVDAVCARDAAPTLSGILVRRLLARHVDARFSPTPLWTVRHYRLEGVRADASSLLSALAGAVSADGPAAARAFAAAVAAHPDTAHWRHAPVAAAERVAVVTRALDTLGRASFQIRRLVLVAATAIIGHDRVIRPDEAEWLRMIADALESPLPPWLAA